MQNPAYQLTPIHCADPLPQGSDQPKGSGDPAEVSCSYSRGRGPAPRGSRTRPKKRSPQAYSHQGRPIPREHRSQGRPAPQGPQLIILYISALPRQVPHRRPSSGGVQGHNVSQAPRVQGYVPLQVNYRSKPLGPRKQARPRGAPPPQPRQVFYSRQRGAASC